jgi:methionine-rich copper-binding protein CopC
MKTPVVIAAALAAWLIPAAAWSHAALSRADPPTAGRVAEVPDDVVLSMTETPVEAATDVVVTDGCERPVVAAVSTHDKEIHAEIRASAQPGRWRVEWATLSAEDGHDSDGKYAFRVAGNKDCSEPAPAAGEEPSDGDRAAGDGGEEDEGSDFPAVPVVLGAAALIGIAFLARGASGKS